MAIVPTTTKAAPATTRGVIFSMSRKKNLLASKIHRGRVAVMGVTRITGPNVKA